MSFKALLKYIGFILFVIIGYVLYTKQLGAIPLLLLSFILFYLGFRYLKRSNE
ncbi:hypothetical protein J19TS1_32330 [Heyndrickxia oleronia]|nr:hypothetical protein J19TS1_32330 [Heyndrickxia oleronia]